MLWPEVPTVDDQPIRMTWQSGDGTRIEAGGGGSKRWVLVEPRIATAKGLMLDSDSLGDRFRDQVAAAVPADRVEDVLAWLDEHADSR